MNRDIYFSRSEVSNSDLSWLKKYELQQSVIYDLEAAYRFGTLVDAIITEPEKVNYFNRTVVGEDYIFSEEEFSKARKMHDAFRDDELCQHYLKQSNYQSVMSKNQVIDYEGFEFELPVRCKWDIWMPKLKWGADIKSTVATTQKQFEAAVRYFDYDRQRAWYMDIAGSDRDMLIGISKVNFKVFKVKITRDGELYRSGREKYSSLAFRFWTLFHNQ